MLTRHIIIFDTAWVDGTHLFHILSFYKSFYKSAIFLFPFCMLKLFSYGRTENKKCGGRDPVEKVKKVAGIDGYSTGEIAK